MGAVDTLAKPRLTASPIASTRLRHALGNLLVAASFVVAGDSQREAFLSRPRRRDMDYRRGSDGRDVAGSYRAEGRAGRPSRISFHHLSGLSAALSAARRRRVERAVWRGVASVWNSSASCSRRYREYTWDAVSAFFPAIAGSCRRVRSRLVRHPIYAGWFLLTVGYLASYPSWMNCLITLATLPFMMWRIRLEEDLLEADPDYRKYRASGAVPSLARPLLDALKLVPHALVEVGSGP